MNLKRSGGHGGVGRKWVELCTYILILKLEKQKDKTRKSCCDINKLKGHFGK